MKSGLGNAATYRALIEVFFNAGKVDYADAMCINLFKDPNVTSKFTIKSIVCINVRELQGSHVLCQVTCREWAPLR